MDKIESVRVSGFRSLADIVLDDLPNVSVMIGPNGSGKSNFVRFFEMLSWMLRSRKLGDFVALHGDADDQLFQGRRVTPQIDATVTVRTDAGLNDYRFTLTHAYQDRFIFTDESFRFSRTGEDSEADWQHLGSGHAEARLVEAAQGSVDLPVNVTTARTIRFLLTSSATFQFHDTSKESRFKQSWDVQDNAQLRSDGGNLAPILLRLEREDVARYELICKQIARILPTFDRFQLDDPYGKTILRWRAKGSDKVIGAHLTSDGSLRFFALVTLLNLPSEMMPSVLLLDEPELGLHPQAVELIGQMIRRVGLERQVIVATQSPLLVDVFDLDQVIVLDLDDGRTTCRQLDPVNYQQWLDDDFAPSDLWWKNVLGGNP